MIRCPSICYSVYRAVNSGTIWYTYGKYKRPWKASLSGFDKGDLKVPLHTHTVNLEMLEPIKVDEFVTVYLMSLCVSSRSVLNKREPGFIDLHQNSFVKEFLIKKIRKILLLWFKLYRELN